MSASIDDVADYIILKAGSEGNLNVLKLQKLLYYTQAWALAFYKAPAFEGKFQAWVHGPVNRKIYDRFKDQKTLYSNVSLTDILGTFDPSRLPELMQRHIDGVIEAYGKFTGTQLEVISHREDPWITARQGVAPTSRCEVEISEVQMAEYYAAKAKS